MKEESWVTKRCLETAFTCTPCVSSNVNTNIFWWWKTLQNQCIIIKIGTRINSAVFFFCVLIQKQLSSKPNFRIIIFVERILNMKRRGHSLSFWYCARFNQPSKELTFGNALVYLFTCPPRNCPLEIIAKGAIQSSPIFWCNAYGHNKDSCPRFQSK